MGILSRFRPKSEFMRHTVTLMTGTSIAQAIPVAISPILTRIYTPNDFGLFALYMAIAGIISIVATARYEIAIVMPEKDDDAINIVALSLFCSTAVSLASFLLILFFNTKITWFLKKDEISSWLYFIPISIIFTSVYQALYYWINRKKGYHVMAVSKVSMSGVTAGTSLGVGVVSQGPTGLIVGLLAGQGVSIGVLLRQVSKLGSSLYSLVTWRRMKLQAKRYSNFPKFSLAADTLNTVSNQLPVILLTQFFGSAVVGFFNLTQRVLGAPLSLIATAIADVFKQKASSDFVKHGNCIEIYKKTFRRLFFTSIVPFTAFALVSPALFAFVFGDDWRIAGEYARIMSVLFFLRFVVSPLSYVLYVAEKQKCDLLWQIALFVVTTASIYAGHLMHNAKYSIVLFTVSYSIMYLIYIVLSFEFAKGNSRGNQSSTALDNNMIYENLARF